MNHRSWSLIAVLSLGAVVALTVAGCGALPFVFAATDNPTGGRSGLPTFDLQGASAIAGAGAESRALNVGAGSRALTEEEEAGLVKILEDGTIAGVMHFENSWWQPQIAFLSVGDDGSAYVGFQDPYSWGATDETGQWVQQGAQLFRIYPDSSEYDILWPPAGSDMNTVGQIDTWGSMWMNQDPMVKGPDGKLYFKTTSYGTGTGDHIYAYDPQDAGDPVQVTPEGAQLSISTFAVDSQGHLFIQSEGWESDARYLRYYTEGEIGYQNIYYSSSDDTWVRGYVTSPDGSYVVMNGYNIRGMNGIIRVNIEGPKTVSYELLYGNANSGSNWIRLYQYYDDTWESGTEIVDMVSQSWDATAFEWREDVLNAAGDAVAEAALIEKISPYFYGEVSVDPANSSFALNMDLSNHTYTDPEHGSIQLYRWITDRPEDYLRTFFDGTLFKDWLEDNGLTELNFDNIGTMIWSSSGALFGLYDPSWWSSTASGTKVVKLLDATGARDLDVVSLTHGDKSPSLIQIVGDVIYYRYAILDQDNQETGRHHLARYNIETGVEEEITASLADLPEIEIVDYDVSDANTLVYFLGADNQTNEVYTGRIDLVLGTWERVDSTLRLSNISVID